MTIRRGRRTEKEFGNGEATTNHTSSPFLSTVYPYSESTLREANAASNYIFNKIGNNHVMIQGRKDEVKLHIRFPSRKYDDPT
jgi:hypothetical protein